MRMGKSYVSHEQVRIATMLPTDYLLPTTYYLLPATCYLPTYRPTDRPTYRPTYLPTCMPTYLPLLLLLDACAYINMELGCWNVQILYAMARFVRLAIADASHTQTNILGPRLLAQQSFLR